MSESENPLPPHRLSMWERLADAAVDHFRVFRVRRTRYRHPRDRREGEFVVVPEDEGDYFPAQQFEHHRDKYRGFCPAEVAEVGHSPFGECGSRAVQPAAYGIRFLFIGSDECDADATEEQGWRT